jgi:hypothetical protein|tara:strand:+ start:205 stop:570 length:366 start_codon:yes stop_codon:yes gene_type:complete
MAREINLNDIGDHFGEKVQTVVRKATFKAEADIKQFTPVFQPREGETGVGGTLRNSWKSEVKPFVGIVSSNIEYAEPVAYGTNLPRSWGKIYRTRQNTIKGYPELIAKQLEKFIADEFRRA